MTLSSAPGKVYLFGEHAVVYGYPAIPCAIERRAFVRVTPRDDSRIRVVAEDLTLDGFTVEYTGGTTGQPDVDVRPELVEAAMGYVDHAISEARDAIGVTDVGFDVTIQSDIPLGAGLGSSAAVTVAAIDAATRSMGTPLELSELAERAYRTEHAVQDGQASRADTFCSTMGGVVRVQDDDCRTIDAPGLPFVVGFDGGAGETGELVSAVRALRDEYGFAAETIEAIGHLVDAGNAALAENDLAEVGRLMSFNHGLLSALGVSSRSLDEMYWAAREGGAHGAKLTGAGGGGCIVALDTDGGAITALEATPGCEQTFRADLASEGVRVEEP